MSFNRGRDASRRLGSALKLMGICVAVSLHGCGVSECLETPADVLRYDRVGAFGPPGSDIHVQINQDGSFTVGDRSGQLSVEQRSELNTLLSDWCVLFYPELAPCCDIGDVTISYRGKGFRFNEFSPGLPSSLAAVNEWVKANVVAVP